MKYRILTDETKIVSGRKLYRIQATKDFGDVMSGDKGGWVESEYNLSQDGLSWIYDEAVSCGNATVSGDAAIYDVAIVQDFCSVSDEAIVSGHSRLTDYVSMDGLACVDNAHVTGTARLTNKASISQDVFLDDNVVITDELPKDVLAVGKNYKRVSAQGEYPVKSYYMEEIQIHPKELRPGFRKSYTLRFNNGNKISFIAYEEEGKLYHDIYCQHSHHKDVSLNIKKCPGLIGSWAYSMGAEIYIITVIPNVKEPKKGLFSRER